MQIPNYVIEKAWDSIEWEEVIKYVSSSIQDKVCQTIVQNMIEETKTDVKKVLSIQGVREKLRAEAYPKIKEIIENL